MCLQVCWKGKFKAFQFLCSYSICINKHQGDGIPFFLLFFGVKLRSTVWIFAILKTVPKMRSLVFVFIFVWTLKALTNSTVTVRFPCSCSLLCLKDKNQLFTRLNGCKTYQGAAALPPSTDSETDPWSPPNSALIILIQFPVFCWLQIHCIVLLKRMVRWLLEWFKVTNFLVFTVQNHRTQKIKATFPPRPQKILLCATWSWSVSWKLHEKFSSSC